VLTIHLWENHIEFLVIGINKTVKDYKYLIKRKGILMIKNKVKSPEIQVI